MDFQGGMTVSYTHLDVYKRQVLASLNGAAQQPAASAEKSPAEAVPDSLKVRKLVDNLYFREHLPAEDYAALRLSLIHSCEPLAVAGLFVGLAVEERHQQVFLVVRQADIARVGHDGDVYKRQVLIYDTNGITRHPVRKDIEVYAIDATAECAKMGQAKLFNTMIPVSYTHLGAARGPTAWSSASGSRP